MEFSRAWLLYLAITSAGFVNLANGTQVIFEPNGHAEYYEQVDIDCKPFGNQSDEEIQSVYFWILPSGDIKRQDLQQTDKHIVLKDNGFVLSIDQLDDNDFGKYYCICKTSHNDIDVIKRGVNIDGPYYGPEFTDRMKHSAIVGGIAAGGMLVVLISIWLICSRCGICNVKKQQGDVENASEQTNDTKADIHMTTIGDSIYYMADGVPVPDSGHNHNININVNHDERFLSSESGHYQSIGSLERNMKPWNENDINEIFGVLNPGFNDGLRVKSPTEIHANNVRVVHSLTSSEDKVISKDETDSVFDSSSLGENATHNDVSVDQDIAVDQDTAVSGEEPVYSIASPRHRSDMEAVTIVHGEVIIESTGTSVVVTTATSPITQSNAVTTAHSTLPSGIENETKPAPEQANGTNEANEAGTDHGSELAIAQADDVNVNTANDRFENELSKALLRKSEKIDTGEKEKDKVAPSSDSGGSSPMHIDEETISNYHNVLANLMASHVKKSDNCDDMTTDTNARDLDKAAERTVDEEVHF